MSTDYERGEALDGVAEESQPEVSKDGPWQVDLEDGGYYRSVDGMYVRVAPVEASERAYLPEWLFSVDGRCGGFSGNLRCKDPRAALDGIILAITSARRDSL